MAAQVLSSSSDRVQNYEVPPKIAFLLLQNGKSRDDSDMDRHFHCPPKSPDMNIIEPIWVALQCAVQKRSPPPGTLMDLRTALQDSWCEKPPGYLQTLVDTMPRRVASLLCVRVGPKRY
ncbi:hypothetical protein AVEN_170313-1 [Araneus ventricosus]|uniref:Tc1-like transposase DDE domain-containing protein n=1 Tax=Araneus ventricosus TaxID=182803 RepID=A0A4Y2CBZ7_ARAVE|nr:hypothetical protein AVEN_170313-1 [Araneus ventricosus]